MLALTRPFPWSGAVGEMEITLRRMGADDRDAILHFARALPEDDLLFLPMDITETEVIDDWLGKIECGRTMTLLAEDETGLVAFVSLSREKLLWTRHVGEILLLVSPDHRARGLGRKLIEEILNVAADLRLQKVVAKMTSGHEGAWRMFESLKFNPEAVLANWVIDRRGKTQDLVIMSREILGPGA